MTQGWILANPVRRGLVALLATAALGSACSIEDALPPSPAAAARAADDALGRRLRAHLIALPMIADAEVVIERAPPDPLARTPAVATPSVTIALVADADAPVDRLDGLARAAARTLVGDDARTAITILPVHRRPTLARLGPFTVAASARGPLLAVIAGALAVIAVLAAALTVVLARRRRVP